MEGPRIDAMNQAISQFKQQICEDQLTSLRADIAMIAFSHTARVAQDFVTGIDFNPPTLQVEGGTKMGQALIQALDMVEKRKRAYRDNSIPYYRALIILITDGYPEHDSPQDIREATRRVHEAEENRKAAVFSFGIDEQADLTQISAFMAPTRPAMGIQHQQLAGLFQWLSNSLSAISASQPQQPTTLPSLDF